LPPRDRLLLLLRAQGLSYRDIAAAAGIRPTSVGRLLARAVDRWAAIGTGQRANEHQRASA
jgi:DNA-directed RNA polymerase specialized sigma24 family protein